jgi:hypothetical protein
MGLIPSEMVILWDFIVDTFRCHQWRFVSIHQDAFLPSGDHWSLWGEHAERSKILAPLSL